MVRLTNPSIVVNFKTYRSGTGRAAEVLAKKLAKPGVILAVQNSDVYRIKKAVRVPVFGQHVDTAGSGQYTGKVIVETLKYNGASGVLINHSEDKASLKQIREIIKQCRQAKITSLVCAETSAEAREIARLSPDIITIEPPALIGTGKSVSRVNPAIVTNTVQAVGKVNKNIDVLCGAGVWTGDDVRKAVELGCRGVLVASALMTAKNPEKVIKEFLKVL